MHHRILFAATISDNTTYAVMALYDAEPLKFFGGYIHIKYANPSNPLKAGFTDIGGYVLAFVSNTAYNNSKTVQVYWTGVRYTVSPGLDLTAAYYGYRQNAYGSGTQAGCSTSAHSTCSGSFEAFSFDADYRFNKHFDAYLGAMYSGGATMALASGYALLDQYQPDHRRTLQVLSQPLRGVSYAAYVKGFLISKEPRWEWRIIVHRKRTMVSWSYKARDRW